jgi:quercetin dioxygenase-like cupin family protein
LPLSCRARRSASQRAATGVRPVPEARAAAVPTVQVDDGRFRVTEWRFAPGAETGQHVHGMDYVVVPMTTGRLRLEEPEGVREVELTAGVSYARTVGVSHNVVNPNAFEFVFVEIEVMPA